MVKEKAKKADESPVRLDLKKAEMTATTKLGDLEPESPAPSSPGLSKKASLKKKRQMRESQQKEKAETSKSPSKALETDYT